MNLREPRLAPGWYPREGVSRFLSDFHGGENPKSAAAAIAPHAGWFYSGKIAAAALSCLDPGAETVAVLGGHLPGGAPPLFAEEDGVRTSLGTMEMDGELRERVKKDLGGRGDPYQDNTVEVLLPMVKYFFPRAKLLWLRLPGEFRSFEAGKILAGAGKALGRKLAVLGSTDLTHYGDNYGFSPQGRGGGALKWMREVNDRAFINAVEGGNPEEILERAERDQSACSVGAVLGVLGYAQALGTGPARLLAYGTSADGEDQVPGSFVGYGAFGFMAQR